MRLLVALVALVAGCSGANDDAAADALLRVPGAQFYRGQPPAPGSDGPLVEQLTTAPASIIRRGASDAVTGFVDRSATSAAMACRV